MNSFCLLGYFLLVTLVSSKAVTVDDNDVDVQMDERKRQELVLCRDHTCSIGRECRLDESGNPMCDCATSCPVEENVMTKVCTKENVTFESDCEFNRQKCMCLRDDKACINSAYARMNVDYYGPCKAMAPCPKFELDQFPYRMREWLFYVMDELNNRNELSQPQAQLAKKAETLLEKSGGDDTQKWMIPVIWKFCDIDQTHDGYLSEEELFSMTSQLKPLEHCTGPFLMKCDDDSNGRISLTEWQVCLQLEPDEVDVMCTSFRE